MSGNYDELRELLSDSSDWDEQELRFSRSRRSSTPKVVRISTPNKDHSGFLKLSSEDNSFADLDDDSTLLRMLQTNQPQSGKKLFGALNQRPKKNTLLRTPQNVSSNWNEINDKSSPLFAKNTSTQITKTIGTASGQRHYSTGKNSVFSAKDKEKFNKIQEEELELMLQSQSNEQLLDNNAHLMHVQFDESLQEQLDNDFDHMDDVEIDIMDDIDIGVKLNNDMFNKQMNKNTQKGKNTQKNKNIVEASHISILDEESSSPIITKPRDRFKYGNTFRLLTQRPGLSSDNDPIKMLNLPKNNKIKIPLRLSEEQENVIKLAEEGRNIFYTGSAGTGKSVLLREMIKVLKKKYGFAKVGVTASTGLAACNIGGITIHSFTGIGLGKGDEESLFKKVRRSRKHLKRWQNISALIVDEISMLDGKLLDKLNYIAQKIRKSRAPFGGIQVIFCGDFFQLPPVVKQNEALKFAFESDIWKSGIDVTIMLQKIFRQQGDKQFIDMLNKMRLGEVDPQTELEFKKLARPLVEDEIIPAELYSTRHEVEKANNTRLAKLPGKIVTYHSIDGGSLEDEEFKSKLLQNFLAPQTLNLKIGAQVMMLKNIDATLVNGSLGKVIDFIDPDTYMFYETIVNNPHLSAEEFEKYKDNPELLKEAYESIEHNEENTKKGRNNLMKKAFYEEDDTPTTKLGESIFDFLADVTGDDSSIVENLNRKRELLNNIHESSTGKRKLPLVRFKTTEMNSRTVLVEPEDWAIEDENEKPIVSRIQLPLMLAWSLSIHKSQGQTLHNVKVDLKRVFEKGQAYVALSRAVSRNGLQVLNFDKNKIHAHENVVKFYETLVSADDAIKDLEQKDQLKVEQNMDSNRAPSYAYNKEEFKKDSNQYKFNKSRLHGIEQMLQNSKRHKPANI